MTTASRISGVETLHFDHAELTRTNLSKNVFIDVGTLSVVYFKELNRFILFLGDWEYALLKRIPVIASSRLETKTRLYTFPTYHGFYTVKFSKINHPEAVQNFETILANYTKLSYADEEIPVLQNETSPDVSLIDDTFESSISASESASFSKKTADNLHPDDVKPGKLKGSQKLKRGFAKLADKISGHKHHKSAFLTTVVDIKGLLHPTEDVLRVETFGRTDIDGTILKSKDIANKMHFGVSPNEVQVIDRKELEKVLESEAVATEIQKETVVAEDIMTKSIKVVPHVEADGTETMMTQSEIKIIKEIEKERELQAEERKLQDEHRRKEQALIDRERQLRDLMRLQQNQVRVEEIELTEERHKRELEIKDEEVLEQARLREIEHIAFEQRQEALLAEIERRLVELKNTEQLSEAEHSKNILREQELLQINAQREAIKRALEVNQKELMKEVKTRQAEFLEREKLATGELDSLRTRARQVEEEISKRIEELKAKAQLTEEERLELQERETAMLKIMELKEQERLIIEKEQEELQLNAANLLADLQERERLTDAERAGIELKEAQLLEESERVLAELRAKEKLTEAEYAELAQKEREVKRAAAFREAERVEFIRVQKELTLAAQRKQAELQEREMLTNAELSELGRIEMELQKEHALTLAALRDLDKKRARLLEDAQTREAELVRREKLTEAELKALRDQEEKLQVEAQMRLTELRMKEQLTEDEHLELQTKEQELNKLVVIRELEVKTKEANLEKLKKKEAEILQKNAQIIEGHLEMNRELNDLKKELDQETVSGVEIKEKIVTEKITQA